MKEITSLTPPRVLSFINMTLSVTLRGSRLRERYSGTFLFAASGVCLLVCLLSKRLPSGKGTIKTHSSFHYRLIGIIHKEVNSITFSFGETLHCHERKHMAITNIKQQHKVKKKKKKKKGCLPHLHKLQPS